MANTQGSKIEASNQDFDTLMKTIHNFLTDSKRTVGLGKSSISNYQFSGTSSLPHTIANGQTATQNSKITETYTASLNVIYDFLKNNYMKTGGKTTTIISNNQYRKAGTTIPSLNQY